MSIGTWPIGKANSEIVSNQIEKEDQINTPMETNQSEFTSSANPMFWIHFRASSVILYESPEFSTLATNLSQGVGFELKKFRQLKSLALTSYYGFCPTVADHRKGRLFIPDMEV